ncbi:NIPSNAP family protein [Brevibacillus sp. TJ4]|uniref:NIPSNAP family protein n=1 Tax=Brevibacillus sp. TJ4 TaxID=3234853 RepID=UPI003BA1D78F
MIYELREYHAAEGKTEALHARFRDETMDLFLRHGISVLGFWTRKDDPSILVYLCRFDSEEQKQAAWAAFAADPDWIRVKKQSESAGPLTTKMVSHVLEPVSYFENK